MALTAGAHVGAYEITSAIGAGGMGEVYRARDTRLKRDVALKILPPAVATDRDHVARFEREAELLAALKSPEHRTDPRRRGRRRVAGAGHGVRRGRRPGGARRPRSDSG